MNDTHTQRNETETHRDKMSKLSERELSRKPNLTSPGQVTTHFLLSGLSLHTGMRKERERMRESDDQFISCSEGLASRSIAVVISLSTAERSWQHSHSLRSTPATILRSLPLLAATGPLVPFR